jgi:hypothetical protein
LEIALFAGLALAVNLIMSFVNIKRLLEDFNWSPILSQGKVFKKMVFFFFFFFFFYPKLYIFFFFFKKKKMYSFNYIIVKLERWDYSLLEFSKSYEVLCISVYIYILIHSDQLS